MKKIRVGFDVSPLYSSHSIRGIGFYTKRLLEALKREKEIDVVEIENKNDLKKKNYDLLHIPYFSPFTISLPLNSKVPFTVTVHDLISIKYPHLYTKGIKGIIKWQIQKNLLKKSALIFTDSQASKKDILSITGYPKEIIVTLLAAGEGFKKIPNSSMILKQTVKKFKLPDRFVLYVGDVNCNKNIPALVKACQDLDTCLVVAGKQAANQDYDKSHPENQHLLFLQKTARKDNRIILAGFLSHEELVAVYNLATVYVQPSIDEGFGLPVLEAMACGCPVISSNKGSLPEVVSHAAVLVEPTEKNIVSSMKMIFNSKLQREKFSRLGLLRAKQFSWEKTARKTIDGYKKVLKVI